MSERTLWGRAICVGTCFKIKQAKRIHSLSVHKPSVSSTNYTSLCFTMSTTSFKFQWLSTIFKTHTHTQSLFPLICHPLLGLPSSLLPLLFRTHTPSLPVSPSFHSCPHILGSPVLRSRISHWNLVHLFPSLPAKRWQHKRKTQRKYRQTQSIRSFLKRRG